MWQQEQMWTEAWTLLDCVHVRVCVSVYVCESPIQWLLFSTTVVETAAVDNCADEEAPPKRIVLCIC